MPFPRILAILVACLLLKVAQAQYRPIELPAEWVFQEPTPAYSLTNPEEQMGTFQPGIRVQIVESMPSGHWHVTFKRYGSPDIHSLIDSPNLAKQNAPALQIIQTELDEFPILKSLLETPDPWPSSALELANELGFEPNQLQVVSGTQKTPNKLSLQPEQTKVWGMTPLNVSINYSLPGSPRLTIELWNKGDAYQSTLNPVKTHRSLQANLQKVQSAFPTNLKDPGATSVAAAITAVRLNEEVYLLPNDLRASLRYANEEYVILSFESISQLQSAKPATYDSSTFRKQIAQQLSKSPEGHHFIQNIPMIDQGKKGYCAAATLARVLQFYGYPVDVHAMAELAETEAQLTEFDTGGTRRDDILKAIRRISNSTPFRLSEIKKERPEDIREVIEQGIPILWFIPGHARLLIGIHPQTNEIVFSDSWGPEYQYETGSWDYFVNANEEMWFLEPR